MRLDQCKAKVKSQFPFPGYIENSSSEIVDNIARTVEKYLNDGERVLDFGSGPCDKTAVVQCLGYECSAFDDLLDDWHRQDDNVNKIKKFARESGIDFRVAEDGYLPFAKESFDMVMLHDVLEHLHDSPRELLNDLGELLKPEGFMFITVPNAVNIRKRIDVLRGKTNLPPYASYFWTPGPWRGHIREYVKDDLKLLSQFLGFKVVELHGCHHMLHSVPRKLLPIYLFLTKVFPGWRDSWLLVARKPKEWRPKREISDEELGRILAKASPFHRSHQ